MMWLVRLFALCLKVVGVVASVEVLGAGRHLGWRSLAAGEERASEDGAADVVPILQWGGNDPDQDVSIIYNSQSNAEWGWDIVGV